MGPVLLVLTGPLWPSPGRWCQHHLALAISLGAWVSRPAWAVRIGAADTSLRGESPADAVFSGARGGAVWESKLAVAREEVSVVATLGQMDGSPGRTRLLCGSGCTALPLLTAPCHPLCSLCLTLPSRL